VGGAALDEAAPLTHSGGVKERLPLLAGLVALAMAVGVGSSLR
jgi:hypothetical protein